jgi:hypothetical protein
MARREKKYNYIYKITNAKNNKYYIGMHSTDNLDDGYFGSGRYLRNSINKHGKENHKLKILEMYPSRKLLKEREQEIVNDELISDKLCMNLAQGGGGFTSEDGKKYAKLGAEKSKHAQKILRETNPQWVENKAKRLSDTNKRMYASGKRQRRWFHDWSGKNHTEETKQKMKESAIGKHNGSKNSQHGTCWMTNGKDNIKIRKEMIFEYESIGWRKGRICKSMER